MLPVLRKAWIVLLLIATGMGTLDASEVRAAGEGKWHFQSADGTEANELGNCAIYSDEASILFFAGTHPKDERFIAFVTALETTGGKEPITWKFKATSYRTAVGDWDYFGVHYVIDDSFFLIDLVRNKGTTIEYGRGKPIAVDLSGIAPVMKSFVDCVDSARRSTPSYETYEKTLNRPICNWNEGVFTATDPREAKARYSFEFKGDGLTSGEVVFMKYLDERLVWSSVSDFGCSNGASICSVNLKLENGSTQDVVFETLETENGEKYIVFSAARQIVYMARSGLLKLYSATEDGENALPMNAYKLVECKSPARK